MDPLTTADDNWDGAVEFGAGLAGSAAQGLHHQFGRADNSIIETIRAASSHAPVAINALDLSPSGLRALYGRHARLIDEATMLLSGTVGGGGLEQLEWLKAQQILHIDPATGHVILVAGDLTSARSVVVAVPGTGTSLGNISGFSEPLGHLQATMGPETAIVTWGDYGTPPKPWAALDMEDEFATAVAPLSVFLRAIQANGRKVILFGHSAGARVVQNQVTDTDTSDFVDGVILSGAPDLAVGFPEAMQSRPALLLNHTNDPTPGLAAKGVFGDSWRAGTFDLRVRSSGGPLVGWPPPVAHGFGSYVEDFGADIAEFTRRL